MLFQLDRQFFCNALCRSKLRPGCFTVMSSRWQWIWTTSCSRTVTHGSNPSNSMELHVHSFRLAHGNNHCHRRAESSLMTPKLQAACKLPSSIASLSVGWMWNCNCVDGWFHPRPSRKQCHCTHPGCLFAWLANTPASHVATWMSLPENTGVFSCRPIEKAAKPWSGHVLESLAHVLRSAQQTLLHTDPCITHKPLYTRTILHTDTLMQRRFYATTLLHTDPFTHRRLYTQTLLRKNAFTHRCLYTQPFTHKRFYTQMLPHTETFTQRHFYTQMLLHADPFTRRQFYTQMLLHTEAFYTQTLLHRHFWPQKILHTEAFTHRRFYTQKLLHTEAFTDRSFYTQKLFTRRGLCAQKLWHTDAFTHRRFYTQTLLHTEALTHSKLLHIEAFSHRPFYTQTRLHTEDPPPLKMYEEGGCTSEFFIHFQGRPHSETSIFVCFFW